MKQILFLLIAVLVMSSGCKKIVQKTESDIVRTVEKTALDKIRKVSEKELGKTLIKAITVLPKESQEYLIKILSENPKLLVFFKDNPRFVSSWEYLRKYLPEDCINPEFLKMFIRANDYASYGGNKLENFVYRRLKDGSIEVLSKNTQTRLATIKPGKIIEVVGEDVNNWFLQLKPFPDVKYIINGAEYVTDDMGRIISSKTKLSPSNLKTTRHRDSNVQKQMSNLKGSKDGDHAGHLIGDQFGGSSNMINLVPMNGNVNTGTFKQLENQWKKAIENGKDVKLDIKLKYPNKPKGCERPDWIEVKFEIDGKLETKLIKNAA